MTTLVTVLTTGKGTWAQAVKVMKGYEWDTIIVVTNTFGMENIQKTKNMHLVLIDEHASVLDLTSSLLESFKERINDLEIALNYVSGTGKEHMALLGAVLKLGVGIRLVTFNNEIKEL